ncbi:hypothetical protein ABIB57_004670, partial [Devosia sp. UYZn731]|uniref:hypothetical protein n=1 Tax=Devosia sp. UYZn731 TaxID=3156345 RepID=UPI003392266B
PRSGVTSQASYMKGLQLPDPRSRRSRRDTPSFGGHCTEADKLKSFRMLAASRPQHWTIEVADGQHVPFKPCALRSVGLGSSNGQQDDGEPNG